MYPDQVSDSVHMMPVPKPWLQILIYRHSNEGSFAIQVETGNKDRPDPPFSPFISFRQHKATLNCKETGAHTKVQ